MAKTIRQRRRKTPIKNKNLALAFKIACKVGEQYDKYPTMEKVTFRHMVLTMVQDALDELHCYVYIKARV